MISGSPVSVPTLGADGLLRHPGTPALVPAPGQAAGARYRRPSAPSAARGTCAMSPTVRSLSLAVPRSPTSAAHTAAAGTRAAHRDAIPSAPRPRPAWPRTWWWPPRPSRICCWPGPARISSPIAAGGRSCRTAPDTRWERLVGESGSTSGHRPNRAMTSRDTTEYSPRLAQDMACGQRRVSYRHGRGDPAGGLVVADSTTLCRPAHDDRRRPAGPKLHAGVNASMSTCRMWQPVVRRTASSATSR